MAAGRRALKQIVTAVASNVITSSLKFMSTALAAGRREALAKFAGMLDTFPFWFNIVKP